MGEEYTNEKNGDCYHIVLIMKQVSIWNHTWVAGARITIHEWGNWVCWRESISKVTQILAELQFKPRTFSFSSSTACLSVSSCMSICVYCCLSFMVGRIHSF